MSIKRTALSVDKNFTMVPNDFLRDSRLSLKARGLLAQIMSHSVGWEITIESLARVNPEGMGAIRTAIKELEDAGYITRERARDAHGSFAGMDYCLSEPQCGNPTLDDPNVGETRDKEDHSSSEDHPSELAPAEADRVNLFDEFWKIYPRKKDRKRASTAWKTAVKRNDPANIIMAAGVYAQDCKARKLEEQFIKHGSTWLNGECWNDYQRPAPGATTITRKKMNWADAL